MKKILLASSVVVLALLAACTNKDCHCTYYDESGNEVPNNAYDYEEMNVTDCSELSTVGSDSIMPNRGFICQ